MIKRLHKIPDRVFFYSVILIIILWNFKYIDMPYRVAYTSLFHNYMVQNSYYAPVEALRNEIKKYPDFYDEGEIGFVSDAKSVNAFSSENTVKSFFIAQYAVIPSVMKDDTKGTYLVGLFSNSQNIPDDFVVLKQINENLYLLKKKKGEKND